MPLILLAILALPGGLPADLPLRPIPAPEIHTAAHFDTAGEPLAGYHRFSAGGLVYRYKAPNWSVEFGGEGRLTLNPSEMVWEEDHGQSYRPRPRPQPSPLRTNLLCGFEAPAYSADGVVRPFRLPYRPEPGPEPEPAESRILHRLLDAIEARGRAMLHDEMEITRKSVDGRIASEAAETRRQLVAEARSQSSRLFWLGAVLSAAACTGIVLIARAYKSLLTTRSR